MIHRSRMLFLFGLLFAVLLPAQTSPPGSSNSRLAEILRLPKLQAADGQAFFSMAASGDPEAQYWLGVFLGDDRFGVTDDVEALNWFRRAADGGDADAEAELCMRYQTGEGVPVDFAQAAFWCGRGAEHVPDLGGPSQGRNNLGILYAMGLGVAQDYGQAYLWLSLAGVKENMVRIERDDPRTNLAGPRACGRLEQAASRSRHLLT